MGPTNAGHLKSLILDVSMLPGKPNFGGKDVGLIAMLVSGKPWKNSSAGYDLPQSKVETKQNPFPRSFFSHPLNETMVDVGNFHIPLGPFMGLILG